MIDRFSNYFPTSIGESVTLCDMQTMGIYDGELKGSAFGYLGRTITLKQQKNKLLVSGSLHKYFNNVLLQNGLANSDDFSFTQINYSVDCLEEEVGKDWKESKLTQLEFGFNIIPKTPVDDIIRSIKMHNKRLPSTSYDRKDRCSKFFEYKNYFWIKVYNKAKEQKIGNHILRFEVKLYPKKLKEFGIKNFNDLKEKSTYYKLFDFLITCLDELVIVESTIGIKGINDKELLLLRSGITSSYWEELNENNSRTTVKRHFDKFNKIISDNYLDKNKQYLKERFRAKFNKLIKEEESNDFLLYK